LFENIAVQVSCVYIVAVNVGSLTIIVMKISVCQIALIYFFWCFFLQYPLYVLH